MTNTLRVKTVWSGEHRHVRFEVVHWGVSEGRPDGAWNYYLQVDARQVPRDKLPLFNLPPRPQHWGCGVGYDYMSQGVFAKLGWHGGITYYAKEGGLDAFPTVFVAGCDYAHTWDEGEKFNVERVAFDARRTIDELWERVPDLLAWCAWSGKFYPLSAGTVQEDGTFVSDEGIAARPNRTTTPAPSPPPGAAAHR